MEEAGEIMLTHLLPLQLAVVVFAVFAVSRTFLRWRDGKISSLEFFIWMVAWVGIVLIVFQPWLTDWVSQKFGIGRGIDFVVYTAIVGILYLIFKLYVKIEDLEQELTRVVGALAKSNPRKK